MAYTDYPSYDPEAPVLVIGAAGVDLVGRLEGELHPKTSNPAHIRTSFGGVARNVAENLARLGQPVVLLTVVGEDHLGQQLLEHTARAGVDVSAVVHTQEHPTGTYLAMVNKEGELQFALDDMRASATLTSDHLRAQEELFKKASLLFLDANSPPATLRTSMSLARKAKLPVCADPTSASLANRLEKYLDRLHLIVPNHTEAAVLCGQPIQQFDRQQSLEAAKTLVARGVDFAIVTLAEFGVVYATSESSGHVPAIKTEIVDPTGGGDALTAAVIFSLLNDIPTDEAIRLGVSAASLTLRHRGAVVPKLSLEMLYDQLVI